MSTASAEPHAVTRLLGAPCRRWYVFFPALVLSAALLALGPMVVGSILGLSEGAGWAVTSVGALLIATTVALLLDLSDPRLRSAREIERVLGWPVVAELPRERPPPQLDSAPEDSSCLATLAAFDHLAKHVALAADEYETRVIAVVSTHEGEGRSWTAGHLAAALARTGHRVVLVGAGPAAAAGASEEGTGWTDLLDGDPVHDDTDARRALVPSHLPGLQRLAAGGTPFPVDDPERRARLRPVLLALRRLADFVVCDTPAILTPDSRGSSPAAAAAADTCLFVAESGRLDAADAVEARRRLGECDTRVLGVAVNEAHAHEKTRLRAKGRPSARPLHVRPVATQME